MQALAFDGQDAIYIPASAQQGVTANTVQQAIQLPGGQTLLAHAGQIVRAQNSLMQGVQTLSTGNQVSVSYIITLSDNHHFNLLLLTI